MIVRTIAVIGRWLRQAGLAILMVMMLLVVIDVVLRYAFNRPLKGGLEVLEMLMVGFVFLTIAHTMHERGHIGIDFVVSRLPNRTRAVIKCFTLTLVLGVASLIVWQSVFQARRVLAAGEVTDWLMIPTFPARLLVPVGMFLFCLEVVIQLIGSLKEALKGVGDPSELP